METVLQANLTENTSLMDLVKYYSSLKTFTNGEICNLINVHHQRDLTPRQLKYIRKKSGLQRYSYISQEDLRNIILNELETVNSRIGYRQMAEFINLKYGILVSKEKVRKLLRILDPEGVQERSRNVIKRRIYQTLGPNDICHIDGNDKLKKWGFCIHGAIDGFSRKLLWLKVSTTNNDPLVIANFYLEFVTKHKIVPNVVRMDRGTENIYVEDLQVFFTNDRNSFLYATSTRNQRIESFWSRLKKYKLCWWIRFFEDLEKERLFKSYLETHVETLLFVFLPILQKELVEFGRVWNARNIRQSAAAPGGKPDILYAIPEESGFTEQGSVPSEVDLNIAADIIRIHHCPVSKNNDLYELLECYCQIENILRPSDAFTGLDIYVKLLELLENDGFYV